MRDYRAHIFTLAFAVVLIIPFFAFGAVTDPGSSGWSIVPKECNCPPASDSAQAAGWGCVLKVVANLIQFAIYLSITISVLMFAYAGFLWVLNPINPENRAAGRKILMNAAIGLLITLSAWLIVNTLLIALGANIDGQGGIAGTTKLLSGGSDCTKGDPLVNNGGTLGGGGGDTTTPPGGCPSGQQCSATTKTCEYKTTTTITCGDKTCGKNETCDATAKTCTPPQACTPPAETGSGANCPAAAPSAMVALPSGDVVGGTGLATPATVQNYIAMRAAALQAGFDLKVSSAYRSDATQVQLWNQYCSSGTCGATKVAKPCSLGGNGSNHNSGEALDLTDGCHNGQSCSSPAYNWLKTNGGRWNFRNAVPTDPVHWSPDGH